MIRVAVVDDLLGVLSLYKELRPNDEVLEGDFAREKWAEIINDEQTFIIVAEIDGLLASSCALTLNKSIANGARPYALIEHVITSNQFRRQGLSAKVLSFAIDLAWQKGCCKVMLLSGAQLSGAHAVYESVGFNADIEKGFVIKHPQLR
ncbi:GNAT family N-acetyltransferase [Psychrobium sp. 1_MG-2023]|uniref:GNAT family N-acetyltransferase n=1 Tax=Psychrobium sp. 1_MG-2023 TaxID=3062624 RepID=UPI000C32D3A2|nr:GNAT family N-acetyltransferase [Psychrobium sp. 1_MG-2023]MDP2560354.1 GNAT family N-acetyltransferase [Psychrobium sp. 1_MG-2023]PKF55463.1 GNAT family N-acetyltransferase [Alteromonadales bacterium alter-6D02]